MFYTKYSHKRKNIIKNLNDMSVNILWQNINFRANYPFSVEVTENITQNIKKQAVMGGNGVKVMKKNQPWKLREIKWPCGIASSDR